MNGIFEDSYLLNRILRSRILDPRYEDSLMRGFESAFGNFSGLIDQGLAGQPPLQVRRHDATKQLPEGVLASIASYYRRATTEAHPMDKLIVAVMFGTLATLGAQLVIGVGKWVSVFSLIAGQASRAETKRHRVPGGTRNGGLQK